MWESQRIMKLTLQPGWKWSVDIKPHVGTDSCQANHIGVIEKRQLLPYMMMALRQRIAVVMHILLSLDMMHGWRVLKNALSMNLLVSGVNEVSQ